MSYINYILHCHPSFRRVFHAYVYPKIYFENQPRSAVSGPARCGQGILISLLSFPDNISKYCTGKMVYINVAVCLAVLLFVVGLSVGLSVNTFKGRDALDSAPLIDG